MDTTLFMPMAFLRAVGSGHVVRLPYVRDQSSQNCDLSIFLRAVGSGHLIYQGSS
jgi:hypothetical protein